HFALCAILSLRQCRANGIAGESHPLKLCIGKFSHWVRLSELGFLSHLPLPVIRIIQQLVADNRHVGRCFDADACLLSVDAQDRDADVVTDVECLCLVSVNHEHFNLLVEWGSVPQVSYRRASGAMPIRNPRPSLPKRNARHGFATRDTSPSHSLANTFTSTFPRVRILFR